MSGSVFLLSMGGISAALGERGYSPMPEADRSRLVGSPPRGVDDVKVESIENTLNFSVSFSSVRRLVWWIDESAGDSGVVGFVVAHGTAALEEVVYLCDFTVKTGEPVVFTGATFHASDAGRDGPHNMVDALRAAASSEARDMGVLVCFAGELHAAREAVKMHRDSPAPFVSRWARSVGTTPRVSGLNGFRAPALRWLFLQSRALGARHPCGDRRRWEADGGSRRAGSGRSRRGGIPRRRRSAPRDADRMRARDRHGHPGRGGVAGPPGADDPHGSGDSGPAVLAQKGLIGAGDLNAAKARLLVIAAIADGCDRGGVESMFLSACGEAVFDGGSDE